jgi:hypothetical protein
MVRRLQREIQYLKDLLHMRRKHQNVQDVH